MLVKAIEFADSTEKKGVFNLTDITDEAQQIIEKAKAQREEILAKARQDGEKLAQEAKEKGFQQGLDQGTADGNKAGYEKSLEEARKNFAESSEQSLDALKNTFAEFDRIKQELLWRAEQEAVKLAIAIAEKLTKQLGVISRSVAVENVRGALELIDKDTDVLVRLNPVDAEYVELMTQSDGGTFGKFEHIRFEPDPSAMPGDCVICTEQGQIDGRLEKQISRIADELLMTDERENEKHNGDDSAEQE